MLGNQDRPQISLPRRPSSKRSSASRMPGWLAFLRRPYYLPTERMSILELQAARGWSLSQTAGAFLVMTVRVDTHLPVVDIERLLLGFRGEVLAFQTPVCYDTVAEAEAAVLAVTRSTDNCTGGKALVESVSSAGDPCSLQVTAAVDSLPHLEFGDRVFDEFPDPGVFL